MESQRPYDARPRVRAMVTERSRKLLTSGWGIEALSAPLETMHGSRYDRCIVYTKYAAVSVSWDATEEIPGE